MERIIFATGVAAEIYERTGASLDAPPGPVWIAERLLGADAIRFATVSMPCDATMVRERGRWRIILRGGASDAQQLYAIAHELGEWGLREYRGADAEDVANLVAACLIAPWPAFVSATLALGHDLPALARVFVTTESMIALRIGETTGEPIALVSPERVRTRGEAHPWPPDGQIREVATHGRPGLRRISLRDDVRRTAVFSAVS